MPLKDLLHKIGDFFEGLFNSAKKAWNKISPELQDAMIHGSAIIDMLNKYVDETPDFVIDAILSKFPDLTREQLNEILTKAAEGLEVAQSINDADLETTVANLQSYLGSLQGSTWAKISHTLALGIAVFKAKGALKIAAIAALMEYVYQDLIKGK